MTWTPTIREPIQGHHLHNADIPNAAETARAERLLEWVGTGRRVVDLGCHKGALTEVLRQAPNEVVGVDFPAIAKVASSRYGLTVVGHDLTQPLPFRDGAFEVVVAASVLDYIPADLAFLRECERVLAPGGRFVCIVPNDVSLVRRIRFALGLSSRSFDDPTGYHEFHRYTSRGIRLLCERAGLRVEEVGRLVRAHSRLRALNGLERLLPVSFATNLMVRAAKRKTEASVPGTGKRSRSAEPRTGEGEGGTGSPCPPGTRVGRVSRSPGRFPSPSS